MAKRISVDEFYAHGRSRPFGQPHDQRHRSPRVERFHDHQETQAPQLLPALRAIYRAETAEMAEQRLAEFEAEWGKKYPAIGLACKHDYHPLAGTESRVRRLSTKRYYGFSQ